MPSCVKIVARDVVRRARLGGGGHARGVGRAVGVAALEAAAGEHAGHRAGPVVAAGVLVDLRRAAELAGADDDRAVQHAAVVEVLDQGRQRLIEVRQQAGLQGVEVLAVRVPAADADGDEADAGLDQPASRERALAERVRAVARRGRCPSPGAG